MKEDENFNIAIPQLDAQVEKQEPPVCDQLEEQHLSTSDNV